MKLVWWINKMSSNTQLKSTGWSAVDDTSR